MEQYSSNIPAIFSSDFGNQRGFFLHTAASLLPCELLDTVVGSNPRGPAAVRQLQQFQTNLVNLRVAALWLAEKLFVLISNWTFYNWNVSAWYKQPSLTNRTEEQWRPLIGTMFPSLYGLSTCLRLSTGDVNQSHAIWGQTSNVPSWHRQNSFSREGRRKAVVTCTVFLFSSVKTSLVFSSQDFD